MAVGGSRACVRAWLGGVRRKARQPMVGDRVLIYGAGSVGRQLAIALEHSADLRVVGFLDDDVSLHGHVLNGLPIYSPDDLQDLVPTVGINTVLLTIPSASRQRRHRSMPSDFRNSSDNSR